jgi:hypothetical protein
MLDPVFVKKIPRDFWKRGFFYIDELVKSPPPCHSRESGNP